MYYDYFGLTQPPFRITPDTSLFYPGGDRGAVLEALIYAILNGEGMVKVVGEVGSGKTMLCRMLEKELPDRVEVVYLANPSLSPENILHAIAFELKLFVQANTSRLQVMHDLQEYLVRRHAENRQVVVFVEEAQAMPIATLEEIRLLSNLEAQQSKLLQIALFGQPELDELISKPEIRQLKERITYSFQLNPFMSEHIRDYVNTRLRASGYRSGEIFSRDAIRKIEHYSKGLLRRVNILADKAMLAAYAENTHKVTARHVKQAARDSEFVIDKRRKIWIGVATAALLLVILASLGYWQRVSGVAGQDAGLADQRPTEAAVATVVEAGATEVARPTAVARPDPAPASSVQAPPVAAEADLLSLDPPPVQARENDVNYEKTGAYEATTTTNPLPHDSSHATPSKQASAAPSGAAAAPVAAKVDREILGVATLYGIQDRGRVRSEKSSPRAATVEEQILGMSVLFGLQDAGIARRSSGK